MKRARALPVALVSEHALSFSFGYCNSIENSDALIHAVSLLSLYLRLGHDEIRKCSRDTGNCRNG